MSSDREYLKKATLKLTTAHFVRGVTSSLYFCSEQNASALCLRLYDANDDSTAALVGFMCAWWFAFEIASRAVNFNSSWLVFTNVE